MRNLPKQKISHFAFAVVLGASVVLGNTNPSCSDVQTNILHRTGLSEGDTKPMETSRFENTVAVILTEVSKFSMITRKAYVVQPGQDSTLPTVTVNGIPYRMHSMEIIPLDKVEGTAAAEIVFTYEKPDEEAKDVSFFVPILAVDNDDLSEGLSSTLDTLNSVSTKGVYKVTFEWLEKLLEQVISARLPNEVQNPTMENVKLYLTNCQNVTTDTIIPIFLFSNLDLTGGDN